LKGKPDGLHFRRQHPVGPYITDFYCAAARPVIEIEGQIHGEDDVVIRDARKTAYLEKQGLIVYRLAGADVMYDPDEAAAEVIRTAMSLLGRSEWTPPPLRGPLPHASRREENIVPSPDIWSS
jgi:very-short-patch-repair endonuclease